LFMTLQEEHSGKPWKEWNVDLTETNKQQMLHEKQEKTDYYMFVQFLCHQQMASVKDYAKSKGVFLMGDIPFFVDQDSVDTWIDKDLFLLHKYVGSPPSALSVEGENWGKPAYNWEVMEKQKFTWWRNRIKWTSQYFDIYRLDHVVGFFQMWVIDKDMKPIDGSCYPSADEGYWLPHGEHILRMILEASDAFPVADDLATVPKEVHTCLLKLGIPETKVHRWNRYLDKPGRPFIPSKYYNPDSLSTISTHDTSTLSLWWQFASSEAKEYCNQIGWTYRKKITLHQREMILADVHHSSSLFHMNLLQEYLAFDSKLISKDPNTERINVPGKNLPSNWTFRITPNLKQVTTSKKLNPVLHRLLPAYHPQHTKTA